MRRMKIVDYLTRERVSRKTFAGRLGVHHSLVYRWIDGNSAPSLELAARIVEVTGGEVTIEDLLAPSRDKDAAEKAVAVAVNE